MRDSNAEFQFLDFARAQPARRGRKSSFSPWEPLFCNPRAIELAAWVVVAVGWGFTYWVLK